MIVTDLLNRTEMLTDCNEISIERTLGGEHTIQFVAIRTERNAHSYDLIQDDSLIIGANEIFVVKDIEDTPYSKSVIALNEFFDCTDDYVEEQWPNGLYSITEALQHAFSTSEWSYAIDGNYSQRAKLEEFGNDNPVSMLNKILSAFNSEYEIDSANKRVIVKRRLGVDTDFQIRDRHNIKAISKSVDAKNVKTAVKVFYNMDEFGTYHSSVIYYSPNKGKYRKIKWREPIYSDTITTESQAIATARLVLKDEPDITFSIEFTTLQEMGYNSDDVQLGNGVFLIDDRMQIESTARIVAIREFYKLVNGQLVKDVNRSPIATISNVQKTISRALVQQQKQQAQIERTAVKQQKIYNGCTITKEDGFKAVAENGVVAFLNATEGIAILRNGVYKFYVNPDGELILDGRLKITGNNVTLLDGYLDENGGKLDINDINGNLNVKIGSNYFNTDSTGGAMTLYSDGDEISDIRFECYIHKETDTGRLVLRGRGGERRVSVGVDSSGESYLSLRNTTGTTQTSLSETYGMIGGQEIITADRLGEELRTLERVILDYVDGELEKVWDEIDDLWRAMPSGD